MKSKIITITFITIFTILLSVTSFASTGVVELKSSVTEVKKGDTFTVTLAATSEDGINAIDTTFTYNSEKLELVNEKLADSSKWSNLGTSPNITVICNSTESIKSADIYILTFKVKDNVIAGDILKIETNSIILDTDAQTNSEVAISEKKVEVTVLNSNESPQNKSENLNNGNNNNNNDNSNKDNKDSVAQQFSNKEDSLSKEKVASVASNTNAKKTEKKNDLKSLPRTGDGLAIISVCIIIATIALFIFYKKYIKHKGIK